MYCMVFDTETTGLDKPFCYDVGYVILDMDNYSIVKSCHYIVEQHWHNLPLFSTAYYNQKRPLYVSLMRAKKAVLDKWGYIMRAMHRDIVQYKITDAYAYNSDFDDKVFTFNCDWFKCNNPLETVAIHDIWGYASEFITNKPEYRAFCEAHACFTDSGNYRGNAETVFQYITNNPEFIEAHMGLHDAKIESDILIYCLKQGGEWYQDYKVNKILPRIVARKFKIKINGKEIYVGEYVKKYTQKDVYSFTTP